MVEVMTEEAFFQLQEDVAALRDDAARDRRRIEYLEDNLLDAAQLRKAQAQAEIQRFRKGEGGGLNGG